MGAKDIEKLTKLGDLQYSFSGYCAALVADNDPIIATAGALRLLEADTVPEYLFDRIVELSCYGAVARHAGSFFLIHYEHKRFRDVMNRAPAHEGASARELIEAAYFDDGRKRRSIEIQEFFRSGVFEHIDAAAHFALASMSLKAALPDLIRSILVNPHDMRNFLRLGRALRMRNELGLLRRLCDIVEKIDIFPNAARLFRAHILFHDGQYQEAIGHLKAVDFSKFIPDVQAEVYAQCAHYYEATGQIDLALDMILKQKKIIAPKNLDPLQFETAIERRKRIQVDPAVIPDLRSECFILTGFPRSGTTLLKTILEHHPHIETFDEIPAFVGVANILDKCGQEPDGIVGLVKAARDIYYNEIDRRRRKSLARIFIDKTPSLAAEATLLKKIFPQKRYVFLIRHPYDVVISCFKHYFTANITTNAFMSFEHTCRAYDYSMSQWFNTYKLDSEQVCYVRYDSLVTNFNAETVRILVFLGVNPLESLQNFAMTAKKHPARTPSHEKIEVGLSLGVQSAWQSYSPLFKRPEADRLKKWLVMFGYPESPS
jgi:tetratricopeptide (TPR) repeat protein